MTDAPDQPTEAPSTAERIDNERFQAFRDLMTRAATLRDGMTAYYLGQAGLELLTEIEWLRSRLVAWDHDLSVTTAERDEAREWSAAWKAVAKRIAVSRRAFRDLSGRHLDRLRELEEVDKEHFECPTHAEFSRFVQEAQDMRRERDDARAALQEAVGREEHWRTMAAQHARERDSFRRTLGSLMGVHPEQIVAAPDRSDLEVPHDE